MPESNVEFIRRYFDAIEAGATPEEMAAFYAPDLILEDFPSPLFPRGARRELAQVLEASKLENRTMRSQRYEIVHAISEGDEIALEVRWSGVLAAAAGSQPLGSSVTARFAIFIRLARGKIARQRNYGCFDAG